MKINHLFRLIAIVSFSIFVACGESKKEDSATIDDGIQLVFQPENGSNKKMNFFISVVNDSTKEGTSFSIDVTNTVTNTVEDKISIETVYDNIFMKGFIGGKDVNTVAGDTAQADPMAGMVAAPVFAFYKKTVNFNYNKQFHKLNEKNSMSNDVAGMKDAESKAQFILVFPKNKIKEGDVWESALDIKIGNKAIDKAKIKAERISDNEVELSIEGKVNGNGEKFGHEFKIDGNFSGKVKVERATGWQTNADLEIHFILEIQGRKNVMTQFISYNQK